MMLSWLLKACFPPGPMVGDGAFGLGNYGYVICPGSLAAGTNQVWRYDPATNLWIQLNNFPGARSCPAVFTINDTVYAGLGVDNSGNWLPDFYKYNVTLDQWIPVASFTGPGRRLAMNCA